LPGWIRAGLGRADGGDAELGRRERSGGSMMAASRSLRPAHAHGAAAALLLSVAVLLSGCSASMVGDHLPQAAGGLPADTPERPADPGPYPAVHSMPPPRATATLNDDQQKLLESDLIAVRNRYGANPGASPATGGTGATDNSTAGGAKNP
jgi:hypothetical protein